MLNISFIFENLSFVTQFLFDKFTFAELFMNNSSWFVNGFTRKKDQKLQKED